MTRKWSGLFRRPDSRAETERTSPLRTDVSPEQYDSIVNALREHVVGVSGGALARADVLDDVDMYDAGYVDSLGVTEFIIRVTDQYDVSLPDWKIGTELKSLRDVARHILAELQNRPDRLGEYSR